MLNGKNSIFICFESDYIILKSKNCQNYIHGHFCIFKLIFVVINKLIKSNLIFWLRWILLKKRVDGGLMQVQVSGQGVRCHSTFKHYFLWRCCRCPVVLFLMVPHVYTTKLRLGFNRLFFFFSFFFLPSSCYNIKVSV